MQRTLGQISDEILKVQKDVKKLNEKISVLEKEKAVLCDELMKAADEQKLEKGGGKKSTFNIHPETVPQMENWDLFYEFMYKKKWLHLLQRRAATVACRELWEKAMAIPGVEKFTLTKVTVKEV